MRTVSVSELKAHLSRYLRDVRRGGEIQVLDRGVPVARLTALGSAGELETDRHRAELIRSGLLRPGSGVTAELLDRPALELPVGLTASIVDDREDRV
jgi:prevent-host-death family protein